jgi:hypothetical protein
MSQTKLAQKLAPSADHRSRVLRYTKKGRDS